MDKLSDAIRAGAKEHKQAFDGFLFTAKGDGEITATSALGAAIYAVWGEISLEGLNVEAQTPNEKLREEFPVLLKIIHPGENTMNLEEWIEVLNHNNRWSREKIAGWVEQFEEEI